VPFAPFCGHSLHAILPGTPPANKPKAVDHRLCRVANGSPDKGFLQYSEPRKGPSSVEQRSIEAIVLALNTAGARYLIAGGLAVVAHGYVRFTADLDLILDLEKENANRGLRALASLGYQPRAPVKLDDFADPQKRREWVSDKGLTVFSLFSREHVATEVDLFVELPFDFDAAYAAAARLEIAPGLPATFVSYEHLVELKRQAGRPQDLDDIAKLQAVRQSPPT